MSEARIEILLVDDNPSDAKLTARWLRASPICQAIHLASDGEQALQLLRSASSEAAPSRVRMVLLDLNLPGMNGLQVLAEIKAEPGLAGIPVVMLSSSRFAEDEQRARELGAALYLSKPSDADEFTAMIELIEAFWRDFSPSVPHGDS